MWSVCPAGSPLAHSLLCFAFNTQPHLCRNLVHFCTLLGITSIVAPLLCCGPQGPAGLTGVCIMKGVWGKERRGGELGNPPLAGLEILSCFFWEQIGCGGRARFIVSISEDQCKCKCKCTLIYNTNQTVTSILFAPFLRCILGVSVEKYTFFLLWAVHSSSLQLGKH